jgi:glycine/D-amino acid oxidase-like deaminating enzyme
MSSLTLPNSLWAATANAGPITSPLTGDAKVDVAIIGAGFTGLRAALVLAEAGSTVAVVDSGEAGWGASGRNGGQVNPIGHESPEVIEQRWGKDFGSDYAQRYVQVTLKSADEVFDLIKKHNIQCDAEQNGWIRAVHGEAAIPAFERLALGWQKSGADLRLIDQHELEDLSGSKAYKNGWIVNSGGSVQPLSYTRGLAQAALSAGATVYTQTHIDHLERVGEAWQLKAPGGCISAKQVILGTNGYSDQLVPGLRESIVPVISIQAATKPLTEVQSKKILKYRHTLADTRRVIHYFKKTADNRLVFGSAGTAGEQPGQADKTRIIDGLRAVYPQFPDLEIDYIWGGQIAVTQDHLPHIHQIAPGLLAGLGCNGRGVALSTVMGRLLAETALGQSLAELPIPITGIKRYPFHRFHRVGIKIAVAWKEFCDNREAN